MKGYVLYMNYQDEGYGDCEMGEAEYVEEQAILQALIREVE